MPSSADIVESTSPLKKQAATCPLQKTGRACALEAAWSKERSWSCLRGFRAHVNGTSEGGRCARGVASHPTGAAPPADAAGPRRAMVGKGQDVGFMPAPASVRLQNMRAMRTVGQV